jgi:hypothetical protein
LRRYISHSPPTLCFRIGGAGFLGGTHLGVGAQAVLLDELLGAALRERDGQFDYLSDGAVLMDALVLEQIEVASVMPRVYVVAVRWPFLESVIMTGALGGVSFE